MVINLENVFNNGVGSIPVDFDFDFSDCEFDGVYPFTTPVMLRGSVINETDIVYIRAKAAFKVEAVCDRCACEFSRDMTVAIEHILVSELNDEDNDEFILAEGMQLDVEQLVLEYILLSLPMKTLCKQERKGMCSQCGKNLNDGPCDCKKEIDPRLAVLQNFFTEDE